MGIGAIVGGLVGGALLGGRGGGGGGYQGPRGMSFEEQEHFRREREREERIRNMPPLQLNPFPQPIDSAKISHFINEIAGIQGEVTYDERGKKVTTKVTQTDRKNKELRDFLKEAYIESTKSLANLLRNAPDKIGKNTRALIDTLNEIDDKQKKQLNRFLEKERGEYKDSMEIIKQYGKGDYDLSDDTEYMKNFKDYANKQVDELSDNRTYMKRIEEVANTPQQEIYDDEYLKSVKGLSTDIIDDIKKVRNFETDEFFKNYTEREINDDFDRRKRDIRTQFVLSGLEKSPEARNAMRDLEEARAKALMENRYLLLQNEDAILGNKYANISRRQQVIDSIINDILKDKTLPGIKEQRLGQMYTNLSESQKVTKGRADNVSKMLDNIYQSKQNIYQTHKNINQILANRDLEKKIREENLKLFQEGKERQRRAAIEKNELLNKQITDPINLGNMRSEFVREPLRYEETLSSIVNPTGNALGGLTTMNSLINQDNVNRYNLVVAQNNALKDQYNAQLAKEGLGGQLAHTAFQDYSNTQQYYDNLNLVLAERKKRDQASIIDALSSFALRGKK